MTRNRLLAGAAALALAFGPPAALAQETTSPSIATPVSAANGGSGVANTGNLTWNAAQTFSFTPGQTMTFPSTSATMARTDAGNTFAGTQTFSNAPVLSSLTGYAYANGAGTVTASATVPAASVSGLSGTYAPLASPTFTGTVTVPSGSALATPTTLTLTNATGLPISTGVSGLGTGVATLLGGTSSGTGGPAGTSSPSFTTPTLGVASATTINKVTLTAPATGSTLTLADGKTLTVNNTLALSGTDSTVMTFPGSSTTVAGLGTTETFTAPQTISSTSATAFGVGANGTTNPGLNVDASASSAATGLNIASKAAASGLALSVLSSGAAENLTIDAKGTGTTTIAGTSTGAVTVGNVTITRPASTSTLTLPSGQTITFSGAFNPTFTAGGSYTYTFPGASTTLATINSANTVTGSYAFSTGSENFSGTGSLQFNAKAVASGTAVSTCSVPSGAGGSPVCTVTASAGSKINRLTFSGGTGSFTGTTFTITFPNAAATTGYYCSGRGGTSATSLTYRLDTTAITSTTVTTLTFHTDAGATTSPGLTDVEIVTCEVAP